MNARIEDKIKTLQLNSIRLSGNSLAPKRCTFYLTMRCNLNCKMCFQKSQRNFQPELSLREIEDVFSDLAIESIFLVGGEIFIRKDILEILSFFDQTGMKISLITNGTLVDDKAIHFLNHMKNLETIYVSLDCSKDINNQIRGRNSFEKTINFISNSNLLDKIHINTVLMEDNISHINSFIKEMEMIGVHNITLQYQMAYSKTDFNKTVAEIKDKKFNNIFRNDCVLENFNSQYIMKLNELKSFNNININFFPPVFKSNPNSYIQCNIREKTKVYCKDICDSVLKINPGGEVMLCEAMHKTYGNIRKKPLNEIWNSEIMKLDRKLLHENNLFSLCNRCCSIALG